MSSNELWEKRASGIALTHEEENRLALYDKLMFDAEQDDSEYEYRSERDYYEY